MGKLGSRAKKAVWPETSKEHNDESVTVVAYLLDISETGHMAAWFRRMQEYR